MNKTRRKAISNIVNKFEYLKSEVENILNEEQDYYDNMPESFQCSERGDIAQESIEILETAINNIEETIDILNEAT